MSDASQGSGWWIASDGKWYPPEQVPGPAAAPEIAAPVEPPPDVAPIPAPVAPTPAPPPAAPAAPPAPPPGAPPATAYVGPPPAKKGGNGCLKAFLIVFAIAVVLGIGVVVAAGFLVKKSVDTVTRDVKAEQKVEDRTGISSLALGFNAKHPPQDDVSPGSMQCTTDSSGNMQASGTITNHSSNASTYTISVSFRQNGAEVGNGSDVVPRVSADGTATWTVNSVTTADGSFSCKITDVERFDTGTIQPTTTR